MIAPRAPRGLSQLLATSLVLLAGARHCAAQVVIEAAPAGIAVRMPGAVGTSGAANSPGGALLLTTDDFGRNLLFQMNRVAPTPTPEETFPAKLPEALEAQVRSGVAREHAVATQNVLLQALRDPRVLALTQRQLRNSPTTQRKLAQLAVAAQSEAASARLSHYTSTLEDVLAAALKGDDGQFSLLYDGLVAKSDGAPVLGREGTTRVVLAKPTPAAEKPADAALVPEPKTERVLTGKDWIKLLTGTSEIAWREVTWRNWTKFLTLMASLPFLLLQWPQVLQNIAAMRAGELSSISILPWMGYGSGILADLLILSWFLSQKNVGPSRVQAMGVVSSSLVLATIWLSGFMPTAAFFFIVPASFFGMGIAYANYKGKVSPRVWNAWSQFLNVLGLFVVPLAITSTLGMSIWITMPTLLGFAAFILTLKAVNRSQSLPDRTLIWPFSWIYSAMKVLTKLLPMWDRVWKDIGAWTATLLFMVGPVAQLWQIHLDPSNIAGIALPTLYLGTLGNLMMLGEATESKNKIWTVGSGWAVVVGGVGVLLSMLLHGAISPLLLGAFSLSVAASLAFFLWRNMRSKGESITQSLAFLGWGKK